MEKLMKREHLHEIYDSIGYGLNNNPILEKLVIRDLPGAYNGEISKLFDGMKKNRSIKDLDLSIEDAWDRLKIKNLADYIKTNSGLERLTLVGAEKLFFEVSD